MSKQEQLEFINKVVETDQYYSGSRGQEILIDYGKHSPEYERFQKEKDSIHVLHNTLITQYLQIFGYPKKTNFVKGQQLALALYNCNDKNAIYNNFSYLYKGYQNGDISDSSLNFNLSKLYIEEFQEKFYMEFPHTTEDENLRLILALELNKKL